MMKLLPLIFFTFYSLTLLSQQDGVYYVSRDLSTWNEVSLKLKVSKAWSFSISEQLRLKTNSSELDLFFTEVGTDYKFSNGFAIGAGYRFIGEKTGSGDLDLEQRFQGDLSYDFGVKRFDFSLRLRGQTRNDIGENRSEDGDYGRRALRLKLEIEYDIKKWKLDPIASVEIFRENGKYVAASFSKFRTTIGTSYKFKKAGEIGTFYRFEKDLNTLYGLNNNIVGLHYKFTLKTYQNEIKK